MQQHNLTQGSPEWHRYRAEHFNASDAPAMLGLSPYKSRAALLKECATGLAQEHDAATERRFAAGHRFEALARPVAESIVGEELYPVVGSEAFEGISRRLSASFDGLTMIEDVAFEHKTLNDDLRACMTEEATGADLPLHYRVQMEQQCMVSGADRVLFAASKWQGDELVEFRHVWYDRDPSIAEAILAGWKQFEVDLDAYKPEAAPVKVEGRAPKNLPALRIEVTGAVTASNLDAYRDAALVVFKGINRDLKTDQDFADAEQTVAWCADLEKRLATAKEAALAQTSTIDELFRTLDGIADEARKARLDLDRSIKARKDAIKSEAIAKGQKALADHVAALTEKIGKPYLPRILADFATAIKGRRTVAGLEEGIEKELTRAKIEANATAERILTNLATLRGASEHAFLFPDEAALVLKDADAVPAIVAARIGEHKANEERRRQEEEAQAAERAAVEAAQQERAAALAAEVVTRAATPAPARASAPAPTADEAPTLKLGAIGERLGFDVSADFLAGLGFEATLKGGSKLYRASSWPAICAAIAAHVMKAGKTATV